MGYLEQLEVLEGQGSEQKTADIHCSKQKSKRQRVRKTSDAKPEAAQETIPKHLRDPVAADIGKTECTNNDLFEDLFGPGPNEEAGGDLLEQMEVDLSEF